MGKHVYAENAGSYALSVAVFGSCVTRDNFNRMFNPDYKALFECVALGDHVSLVSLMAPPLTVAPERLDGLSAQVLAKLNREFSRTFLDELRDKQPDYLVMDFWPDLIFGFADLRDGSVITHNAWSTIKTSFFKQEAFRNYRPDTDRGVFFLRWKAAVDAFFDFASKAIPNTRIVVHSARNVRKWIGRDGALRDFSPWAVTMNQYWDEMDAYVNSNYTALRIDVMTDNLYSFEDHPWGKFPVHYTFDYHSRFLACLSQIALRDILSGTDRITSSSTN